MAKQNRFLRFELFVGYAHVTLCLLAVSLFLYKDMSGNAPFSVNVMMAFLGIVAFPQLILTALSHSYGSPFRQWSEASQVFILIAGSLVTAPAFPDRSYCVLLVYMAFFLSGKYGFLNTLKSALMFLLMGFLMVECMILSGPDGDGVMFAAFHLFFFGVIGFGYRDGIIKSRERNAILKRVNDSLKEEILNRNRISDQLAAVRLNVKDFSFTPAEKELLELMCIKGMTSNRELAEHLNKSVSTVKSQLYSIFEKTGIHKRSRLIAFFREN